jgi:hypothetical protein
MSVVTDGDISAQQKTEFDAEFGSTDDGETTESDPICALTCMVTDCT